MYFFGLVTIATAVSAIKAEVDCTKRPPYVNINNCCEVSDVLSEEVKEKCGTQQGYDDSLGPHNGPPGHHKRTPKHGPYNHCFLSCAVNAAGILVDGQFQEDNVNSYLNDLFGDGDKVDFLKDKFMLCNERRNDFESKWPGHRFGRPNCPSEHSGMLIGCVHMEAFKDCPNSFWSNTDECNKARDHFNQCSPFKEKHDEEFLEVEEGEADQI